VFATRSGQSLAGDGERRRGERLPASARTESGRLRLRAAARIECETLRLRAAARTESVQQEDQDTALRRRSERRVRRVPVLRADAEHAVRDAQTRRAGERV